MSGPLLPCKTCCMVPINAENGRLELKLRFSKKPVARTQWRVYHQLSMNCMRRRNETLRPGATCRLSLVVCAAVCGLLLGSCSAASTGSRSSTRSTSKIPTVKTGSTTTSSTSPGDGQIISAWFAAERAFHNAALTSDSNSPELAATMVPPLLNGVEANLAKLRTEGVVAKGPTYWGSPQITVRGPGGTEVVSCIHDEQIEIVGRTGRPVPGIGGQPDFALVRSIMQSTPSGWKMADQSAQAGKCGAS